LKVYIAADDHEKPVIAGSVAADGALPVYQILSAHETEARYAIPHVFLYFMNQARELVRIAGRLEE